MIRVSEQSFDPGEEFGAFERGAAGAGAVVSFLGKVRGKDGADPVKALYLEHYAGVTEASIAEVADEARRRWKIDASLIIHRVGRLEPGEPIVLVCASAAHRRDAFDAANFLMDYLKTKALFWKKEIRASGEEWIEPRDQDYRDADRWKQES